MEKLVRAFHFIDNLDPDAGGPAMTLAKLAAAQAALGLKCHVVSLEYARQSQAITEFLENQSDPQGVRFHRHVIRSRRHFVLARQTLRAELNELREGDIVHVHGIWSPISLAASRAARRRKLPCIVRPAGMLKPWSLSQKSLKKKIAMHLGFGAMLRRCKAMHATATEEAQQIRELGYHAPIAVIANGVDLRPYDVPARRELIDQQWPQLAGRQILLFLSRIHPVKGLNILGAIWNRIATEFPDWRLVIAGPDYENHQVQIRKLLDDGGTLDRTTFTGPVAGELKAQLMRNSSLFVLPSKSENFGVVVAESLASAVPVITTHGTPWEDLEKHQCGWWVPYEAQAIHRAVVEAMKMPAEQRATMGRAGRELVTACYTVEAAARQTVELYRWLHGQADEPSFLLD